MEHPSLDRLGWSGHFARQITPGSRPARIASVQRSGVTALSPEGNLDLRVPGSTGDFAVGDWVLHDGHHVTARLTPRTEIVRRAAGVGGDRQLIAANVDTLAIVTSCNADFNVARLERYLALALAAGCLPLVVLTRADEVDDPGAFLRQAERLSPLVTALALDARDPAEARRLEPWLREGQTMALLGSSGVGKTTLLNALTGAGEATQGIREDDAKGRHTTTARNLRPALAGGWIIDTPGMRELRLTDAAEGIAAAFDDIETLAAGCRFADCAHETEPGCAVQAAVAAGTLDVDRLARWRKLAREDRATTEAVHERHARARALGRLYRQGKARAAARRRGPGD